MKGFVWNNGVHEVMWTYTPDQLPVINGLAREFAVSDAWFSSMPSATDPNRAFAFTGSSLRELNNFQNGPQYLYWPYAPHRSSIWKALWTNGFTDWKIYNSVVWMNFVHTYHLFLQGQIPSVDAAIAQDARPEGRLGRQRLFARAAVVVPRGDRSVQDGGERRATAALLVPRAGVDFARRNDILSSRGRSCPSAKRPSTNSTRR